MQTEFIFPKNASPSTSSLSTLKPVPSRRCKDIRTYLDQLQYLMLENYKVLQKTKDHYWVELKFEDGYTLTVMMER